MINSVEIFDLATAVSQSFKESKHNAWISTVDEEDRNKIRTMKKNFGVKKTPHFVQYFYDWSDEDQEEYIKRFLEDQGPQIQHVNSIITFIEDLVKSNKVYEVGINCFAGISRSTAIALLCWKIQGFSAEESLDKVLKKRYQAWPNLRILKLASERVGDGLYKHVVKWKENCKGVICVPQGGWEL